jgi:copper chaperone CopZ
MVESLVVHVPRLYADHHVKRVRELLFALPGVQDVVASSLEHSVIVSYDPAKLQPEQIRQTLADGGYPPGEAEELAAAFQERPKSAWYILQQRILRANPVDRRMAGDFRKY